VERPPPPERVLPEGPPPLRTAWPQPPGGGAARGARRRGRTVALAVAAAVVAGAVVLATTVRLPYYTISPGATIDVNHSITIEGTTRYEADGELRLVFVRQHGRVTPWEWVRASLDPDVDLVKEEQVTGGRSPEEVEIEGDAEMALAKIAARKVALESVGYEVPRASEGLVVLAVQPSRPAGAALEPNDVLLAADGAVLTDADDLREAVGRHEPGEEVALRVRRDGRERDVVVGVACCDSTGAPVVGVVVAPRFDFPVDIEIDTREIGGPSAGLAMTLSIIDTLTPGELTGGVVVAATGTIGLEGEVGQIGAIQQKVVTARAAGADLFIAPACTTRELLESCRRDLARAVDRAGDMPVVPVATLDDALRALEDAGGDPLPEGVASLR
jgi:PDZ domain-containing protein